MFPQRIPRKEGRWLTCIFLFGHRKELRYKESNYDRI